MAKAKVPAGTAEAIYAQFPGHSILLPSKLPPRPSLFTEIKFGEPLTEDNAFLARRFWAEPDNHLRAAWQNHRNRPYERAADEQRDADLHVLAHNVYEHLMSHPFIPVSREDAQANYAKEGLDQVYNGIQGLDSMRENVFVNGRNVQDETQWTVALLRNELEVRGLTTTGKKQDLQERLWRYEVDELVGVVRQSDLSRWGISRTAPILSPATNTQLTALDMYTSAIYLNPYNPTYWTSRAYCYYQQGFFDLAIGDAYRSDLLCEVLTTATQRNKRPGFYTRVWDAIQMHMMAGCRIQRVATTPEVTRMRKANGINYFIPTVLNANTNIISLCLAAMNCWDDFELLLEQHERRNLQFRDMEIPKKRSQAVEIVLTTMKHRKINPSATHPTLYGHEWMQGCISGAVRYPYQQTDVNRQAGRFVDLVNANVFTSSTDAKMPAHLCEVRPVFAKDGSPNGLGVFARAAIPAGTLFHYEEPVIRGHLHPNILDGDMTNLPSNDPRCENCKAPIARANVKHIQDNWGYIRGLVPNPNGANHPLNCWCLSMVHAETTGIRNDMLAPLFCHDNHTKLPGTSRRCKEIATELYAFEEFKDIEWGWLQDSMRANIKGWGGKDYYTAHHEEQGTFLGLLFESVMELTLHRRQADPNLMPHEINELLILQSGTDAGEPWHGSWFPFTMSGNIRVPFDILQALGVDIFRDFSFDTWTLQLVLRKLLINAVPWNPDRRGNKNTFTEHDGIKELPSQQRQDETRTLVHAFDFTKPSITDLYLFPGLSMFNHACRKSENASWGYDTTVQNRVVVFATQDIAANTEIRIPYQHRYFPAMYPGQAPHHAMRLLGKGCNCDQCTATGPGSKADAGRRRVAERKAADQAKARADWAAAKHGQAGGSGAGSAGGVGGDAAADAAADAPGYGDDDGDDTGDYNPSKDPTFRPKAAQYIARNKPLQSRRDRMAKGGRNEKLAELVASINANHPEFQIKQNYNEPEEVPWTTRAARTVGDGSNEGNDGGDGDIVLKDAS
jgi:hypothetical protein